MMFRFSILLCATLSALPSQEPTTVERASPEATPAKQERTHPVPEDVRWLTYPGAADETLAGHGLHVVFVAAEQEYRAEQAMPMLARLLSERHGFHCTVLFALKDGKVDPTQATRPEDPEMFHDIPGLEHLASADLFVVFTRFITLPDDQLAHVNRYLDSGKPILGIRTANHGFRGNWTYKVADKRVDFGVDILGGTFLGHHGGWHREATRGIAVEAAVDHPILRGVEDVFGPSDVYRTYREGGSLPEGCTPLLLGQPLRSLDHDAEPNTDKEPLPVAWTKTWTGNAKRAARVFHVTMGSARDFQSAGLRRLFLNAALWCANRDEAITPELSVDLVGDYEPLDSGFDYKRLGVKPHEPAHYR